MNLLSVENRTRTYQTRQSARKSETYDDQFEGQLPLAIRAELKESRPKRDSQPLVPPPVRRPKSAVLEVLVGLPLLFGTMMLVLLLVGWGAGTIGSRGEKRPLTQAEIDALVSVYQPRELQIGTWYRVTLPDGTRVVACYQGQLPSSADLPEPRFLGEEWKVGFGENSHFWIWAVPSGAHVASWVDP